MPLRGTENHGPSRNGRLIISISRRFWQAERGVAAVEFALCGLAIMAFMMAIVNFGLLGFSLGAMERATEATARTAAMYASNQYASTGTMTCPSNATVVGYFNQYGQPPLPGAGTTAGSNPLITIDWTNNSDGTNVTEWHGVYLTLTVQYNWHPIGFLPFVRTIPLSITTASTVMGSFDIPTVVASSCQ
jgi:Flp pilus assembly protein TadG